MYTGRSLYISSFFITILWNIYISRKYSASLAQLALFVKRNWNDQVKEDEVSRACRMHGEEMSA
jgi:hypothetical protein